MINHFVTYYEPLKGFESSLQQELLACSLISWQHFGFETKVLSHDDAKAHKLYKPLLAAARKHTKSGRNSFIQWHSEASIVRWLAFARSNRFSFFCGDYDIFNLRVRPGDLVYRNLTFLDQACLCFAYASDPEWCEHFAEIFINNIDIMKSWNRPHGYYHDQDFVVELCKQAPHVLAEAGITLERKHVASPMGGTIPENCKFLHVSHRSCRPVDGAAQRRLLIARAVVARLQNQINTQNTLQLKTKLKFGKIFN